METSLEQGSMRLVRRKGQTNKPFGELMKLSFERLKYFHGQRVPTLIPGPTGCGKTTLIEWLIRDRRLGQHEIATGNSRMSPTDLLGRNYLVSNGYEEWADHALPRAVVEGKVFYFDEIHEVDDDVITLLLPLLDHRRELVINKKKGIKIKAHKNFWFVGSYNPPARLPAHLRHRCRFLPVDYLKEEEEMAFLIQQTGVSPDHAQFLVRAAAITRSKLSGTLMEGVSTRILLFAAQDLNAGWSKETVARETILAPLVDDPHSRDSAFQALESAGLFSLEEIQALKKSKQETDEEENLEDDDIVDLESDPDLDSDSRPESQSDPDDRNII